MTTEFYQDYYRTAARMIGTPGLYFGKTIKEEMARPALLEDLIEAGIVWYEWEGDCEAGVGDWNPQCKPRHFELMRCALLENQERLKAANCKACKAKWGDVTKHVCPHCWARPKEVE